ncbi:TolC family protein [Shimwellia pseudoproteus]|uniref:TolC family protein n=1 Tax=Shimwellia pseudoproteus TaxID=570012 RepID=UPI0018EC5B7E|nr:TolC family protein [Shimwellia pseudoproteus]MBJ3816710.1 TolC family protein [Shimwellia pseudoproteus]
MTPLLNTAARGLPLLLCLLAALPAHATTLDQAIRAAESYSAALSANSHQVNALNNMADSATQLPDPKLKFGVENVPVQGGNDHRFSREGMTMQKVGIMQEYVSSTKRERKADAIRAQAQQTEAGAALIRATLQRDTAQAWFNLALSRQTLTAVEALINETRRQVGTQRAGVASGGATPSSVLDVELALNAMRNEEDNARRDVQIAQANLQKLTGDDITDTSGTFPRIERLPADQSTLIDGIKQHPEVVQAARAADSAKAKSAQSEVAAIPDVGVEVYYARRGNDYDDMAGVMFTVDLPIFQSKRQDKDHAADMSRTYEANDQLTQLVRQHQADLAALIAQYNAAKAIYDRQNQDVLPLLHSKISLVEAQYQSGSATLAEILAARRDLLNGEVAKNNAAKALADSWAAIRYLIPQDVN